MTLVFAKPQNCETWKSYALPCAPIGPIGWPSSSVADSVGSNPRSESDSSSPIAELVEAVTNGNVASASPARA